MAAILSKVRWARVFLAGAATHVINTVLAILAIIVYTLLAIGPQGAPEQVSVDRFAGQVGTWGVTCSDRLDEKADPQRSTL